MTAPFYTRLRQYYLDVAKVLRGEAAVASIFPNTTDIGMSREAVYKTFLAQHLPSKCNVFLGGFLFGHDGSESHQIDVIVTTDTAPSFNFHSDKSFAPVEGTLAIASVKSTLNKLTLEDALRGIASIPATLPLDATRQTSGVNPIQDYDNWPYKIIYGSDGIAGDTLLGHLNAFYASHPEVPVSRRPDMIHVCGKYIINRSQPGLSKTFDTATRVEVDVPFGTFMLSTPEADLQGLTRVLSAIQVKATTSTHILYSYWEIANRVVGV